MSVASQLINPPTYRYPHIRSGVEWSSYGLDNLAIEKFYDFRFAKADSILSIYAGGPNDSEQEKTKYIEGVFSGAVFNQPYWEEGDVYDFSRMVTDIRLFISHNGAYLLEQHRKLRVKKNQLAIFVEIPDRDILSKQVLLVKAGENAKKYSESVFRNYMDMEYFTLTEKQVKQLISSVESGKSLINQLNSILVEIKNAGVDFVIDLNTTIIDGLVNFLDDKLRISEKQWNSKEEDYAVGKVQQLITDFLKDRQAQIDNWLQRYPKLPGIVHAIGNGISKVMSGIIKFLDTIEEGVQILWAFRSGLWNGLIDLISGLLSLLKLVFKGIEGSRYLVQNSNYYKALTLEYLDNLLQAIVDIDWAEWFRISYQKIKELIDFMLNEVPDFVKSQIEALNYEQVEELIDKGVEKAEKLGGKAFDKVMGLSINHTEIAYYGGYIVFEIASFFFPPLKASKIGKGGERVTKVMDEIAKGFTEATGYGLRVGKSVADDFFKHIDTFIKDLKNGSQKLAKFLDDLLATLRKQSKEAVEVFNAPKIFKGLGVDMRTIQQGGKEVVQLKKRNGKIIFEGTQKEALDLAERLKGKTSKEAKVILEEIAELQIVNKAIKKLKIEINVPKNLLSEAESLKKIEGIFQTLKRLVPPKHFDPNKEALKKLGIKLKPSKNGLCADFAGTKYLYPTIGKQKNIVKIKLTGSRLLDDKLAYELAGIKKSKYYTWHHMDDFDPVTGTCTMQLVEKIIHQSTIPHTGSVKIIEKFLNFIYKK